MFSIEWLGMTKKIPNTLVQAISEFRVWNIVVYGVPPSAEHRLKSSVLRFTLISGFPHYVNDGLDEVQLRLEGVCRLISAVVVAVVVGVGVCFMASETNKDDGDGSF
jgi:hypothetical protein